MILTFMSRSRHLSLCDIMYLHLLMTKGVYLAALEKYPVLTKALTSAILTFIGDLICQLLIDQVATLDVKRTFVFTLLGFVLVGPTLHF
ncbi:Peroxisomal membrane (Mpv17/PMP22) family protein, partial [Thalictrum thalictroides]